MNDHLPPVVHHPVILGNRDRRRSSSLLAIVLLIAVFVGSQCGAGESMSALIIGNGAYPEMPLANPTHDAELMSQVLGDLGFRVTTLLDQTHQQMDVAIGDFCRQVPKNGLALFFYAGHGLQSNGENYLIPVDAKIQDESAVKYKTVSQNMIIDSLNNSGSNMNVVVLDCCRDNPFERAWKRSVFSRGLAPTGVIPDGTIIYYATRPGETAMDGAGKNSPYTMELANAFSQRPPQGLILWDVFRNAGAAVRKATGQRPWLEGDTSLDRFYLYRPDHLDDQPEVSNASLEIASLEQQPMQQKESLAPPPSQAKPAGRLATSISGESSSASTADRVQNDSLMRQANTFLNEGDYELAIDAFSALISDSRIDEEFKMQARKSRAVAYLGRRGDRDIDRAIIDYKACGEDGVPLAITADSAELKVGDQATSRVRKHQVALVTLSNGDWLWIRSVHGDENISGWVKKTAFAQIDSVAKAEPVAPTPRPEPPKSVVVQQVVTPPTSVPASGQLNTQRRPSSTPQHQPLPQPIQQTNQFSPMNQFGSNQRIQTQPQPTSNTRTLQPTQNTSGWNNLSSGNRTQNQSGSLFRNPTSNSNSGDDAFTQRYKAKHGRPPSIWETPRWESPAEIRRLRAQGKVR